MKYLLILAFVLLPLTTFAHPGNTVNGVHTCWTNCAYWGEIYGVPHGHQTSTYIPAAPMEYEDWQELYEDFDDYEKIKNGFKVGDSIYCRDGYLETEDECKVNVKQLKDSSKSLKDASDNATLRMRKALEKNQESTLEDFTDNDWKKYKKIILEIVSNDVILNYAPDEFIKENKITESSSEIDSLKAQIEKLTLLLNQLLNAKNKLNGN